MIREWIFRILVLGVACFSSAQIPLDSLHGPLCGMVDPETKAQVAISPIFTRVNAVITDAIAQVVVTQKFVNPFHGKSEVVYLFPLPDQGGVHGMKYRYHDSTYVAKIMERAKAQATYDSIKNNGGQAALLLQERPNIFMQRIASMDGGDTSFVEITLSMPLKYVDGELELAFPTMIGPRYQSGAPKTAAAKSSASGTLWNPPADRVGAEFEFNVLVESGVDLSAITSPSHPIEVNDLAAVRKTLTDRQVLGGDIVPKLAFSRGVLLKSQVTYPNRDYVLRLKRARTASDFSLAVSKDPKGNGSFMLNLYPDPTLFAGKRPDMEVVLLVDISGSQSGWPLDREKEITLNIMSRLNPNDKIDLLAFSGDVFYAYGNGTPVAATPANIAKGETFVRGLSVQGGTQLLAGVNAALAVPADPGRQRIFIFLTDGFITGEASIIQAISNHPSKPTIFTFGAGNNLNRSFLEECAKVGNGFATPVVEGDAVGSLVEAAWSRIESPQLENIQVSFGGLETADVLYPTSRKLYMGLPYRVSGKFMGGGNRTVTLTGDRAGKPVSFSKDIDFSNADALSWAVPKLWGREKINQLVLAQGTHETNRDAIIAVSLEYQVLCAYTAFLATAQATEPDGGKPVTTADKPELSPKAARFGLAMHGGLLFLEFLDWNGAAKVEAVRIYDLHGRLMFTFTPGANAQSMSRWVWDGRDSLGRLLGRGLYLISVQTHSGLQNRTFAWDPNR